MTAWKLARPEPEEAAPFYHAYIASVRDERIGEHLRAQLETIPALLAPLDDAQARFRYAEGKWSIKEIVGHLSDAERIFTYRLLRIARGDTTPLAGFDENAYVPAGEFDARPLSSLLEEFRTIRLHTIALIEGVPLEGWSRRGEANGYVVSARAIPYIIVGHTVHHLQVLEHRYGVGPKTSV